MLARCCEPPKSWRNSAAMPVRLTAVCTAGLPSRASQHTAKVAHPPHLLAVGGRPPPRIGRCIVADQQHRHLDALSTESAAKGVPHVGLVGVGCIRCTRKGLRRRQSTRIPCSQHGTESESALASGPQRPPICSLQPLSYRRHISPRTFTFRKSHCKVVWCTAACHLSL